MVYEKGFAIVGIGCRFPGGVTSLDGLYSPKMSILGLYLRVLRARSV